MKSIDYIASHVKSIQGKLIIMELLLLYIYWNRCETRNNVAHVYPTKLLGF